MNIIKSNPFINAILNAIIALGLTCGAIYARSLIDNVSFLTKLNNPLLLFLLITCPIVCGISTFAKTKRKMQ